MTDLFDLLQSPTVETLKMHSIAFFDKVIEEYPDEYENIISYINECFNYHSSYLVDEKDWGAFLMERFRSNLLSEDIRSKVINYECPIITVAIADFLDYQKQPTWTTFTAKQNTRTAMLATMQNYSSSITDKKNANELVTTLDIEINDLLEKMKQEQKRFGNYQGVKDIKTAKKRMVINIAHYLDNL